MKTLVLRPEITHQTIDNFAASDSWTVEPLIRWPEKTRKEIARLLFCQKTGAGLSGWRFNLGGGINHETISNPMRTADTFDAGEGKFDFTRVPGQRWMLEAAKGYKVPRMIAYSVTPPKRLTKNGFTNGTDGLGSTNLKDGEEAAYARYLVGAVEHFVKQGYPFMAISPINEPDYEWNKGSQEGNRASNDDIMRINRALAQEIKARSLPLRVLGPEASSPQVGFRPNDGMARKYKAPYGNYAAMFADNPEWRQEVKPIYGYHSYWSDAFGEMVELRQQLRKELDRTPGLEVWQTEYCQMKGPRNEGGWGRDIGMTLALNTARLMQLDLTIVGVSAWQWWLGVSDSDYKDGLVYVDDLEKEDGTVFASKTLFAIGQFSRFVRPGFQRIESSGVSGDIHSTLASGYRDPKSGQLVVVLVNPASRSEEVQIQVPGRWKRSATITSDRPGHDIARWGVTDGKPVSVPSRSVVTVVLDPLK